MDLNTIPPEMLAELHEEDVRFVRVLWCDNAGVIRAKARHVDALERGGALGIAAAQQALPVMRDAVVPGAGLGPAGEVELVPDWTTLHLLPYLPGYAEVGGDLQLRGEPWEHCPRAFLREQLARLNARGLTLQVAFENEFYLLGGSGEGVVPSDDTVFAAAHAFNHGGDVILEVAEALAEQGLEVESYYPESGPGQHELVVRHRDALGAADQQLVFRETVRGVATAAGLVASFLPKVLADRAGSGCHLNLSLWRDGANVTGDAGGGLGREAQRFVAGLLEHLPALCAVTVPSANSYRRLRPHAWAGAFRTWGRDNREAAVRVCGANGAAPRLEFKTADATANPFLALGAVVAAGLDGLERELPLPPETPGDPGRLDPAARRELGAARLPETLGRALEALEADETLLGALGEARARAFVAVRRAEWEELKDATLEEEVSLLLERY